MSEPSNTVRIALIQHACGPDPKQNLDGAESLIRDAARQGAQIIATQELFTSRYFPQVEDEHSFDLAQPIPGPDSNRLSALAKELDVELVASLFERRAAGLYHNTLLTIAPTGQIINLYRKMHIPDDPGFYEKYYFTPGDAPGSLSDSVVEKSRGQDPHPDPPAAMPWRSVATRHARIGTLVCWDQWYPEAARLCALHGAQVLFYPTAIGWHRDEQPAERQRQKDAWCVIQRSHAIANGVYVVAINRVGVEGDLEFWGSSFVADPGGGVIAEALADQPQVMLVDCDLGYIERVRRHWPFLRDRRVDAYRGLTARYLGK